MFACVCERQERRVKGVKMARGLAEPMGVGGGQRAESGEAAAIIKENRITGKSSPLSPSLSLPLSPYNFHLLAFSIESQ